MTLVPFKNFAGPDIANNAAGIHFVFGSLRDGQEVFPYRKIISANRLVGRFSLRVFVSAVGNTTAVVSAIFLPVRFRGRSEVFAANNAFHNVTL